MRSNDIGLRHWFTQQLRSLSSDIVMTGAVRHNDESRVQCKARSGADT